MNGSSSYVSRYHYFPGLLDPDGRPWDRLASQKRHDAMTNSIMKAILLTQFKIVIPGGYFLDNLSLRNLVSNYSNESAESKSFRAVMRDLIYVSVDSRTGQSDGEEIDWEHFAREWAEGKSGQRRNFVYLNSLPHDAAVDLQSNTDTDKFLRDMDSAYRRVDQTIDHISHLKNLKRLELPVKVQGSFPFEERLNEQLLEATQEEINAFGLGGSPLIEKMVRVGEKANKRGYRISRSLLSNAKLCKQIGIESSDCLSRTEYLDIVDTLAYFHHMAFAESIKLGGFLTRQIPVVDASVTTHYRKRFLELLEEQAYSLPPKQDQDILSMIRYQDIFRLRIKDEQFRAKLHNLHVASRKSDQAYRKELRSLKRHVASAVPKNFKHVSSQEIAEALSESVDMGKDMTGGGILEMSRLALALLHDLIPNIRREYQIRSFYKHLHQGHGD